MAAPTNTDWESFVVLTTNGVAEVIIDTPRRGNVLGPDFWRELPEVFDQLDRDRAVRSIVLAAQGQHFSYGIDLKAMPRMFGKAFSEGGLAAERLALRSNIVAAQKAITALEECSKPVVAAVHGWCIGGAVDLIAAADIRYASADAIFSIREIKLGIVADLGSLQRLPPLIGEGHTRELAMTGDDISAERAQAIGLVNAVLPDHDSVVAHALAAAQRIAANPPLAVQGVKHVLNEARHATLEDGLKYVAAWNSAFLPSSDVNEAITAVFEKRAPRFTGA
ncbi:crotonase/enoyl-CoA hydratase family protein [Rhodococcus opacus]|uniref:Enoyl-CoA hydratase n=1 Tax=Rhodococcus opacus TaxID=37919 RepID=A0A076F1H7_RHOOP|nr:crotonase/enoyl-CoA hydratase family protein [Rhodococcus opacus]AII11458.1 enoyl-CoA hydratase [Rhodococcus opacus]